MIFIDIIYEKMIIKLPKIVNGNVIYSENDSDLVKLFYPNDVEVHIPKFTSEDVSRIKEAKQE